MRESSVIVADGIPATAPGDASATALLEAAVHEGQERYFARCQRRIPGFVARHMSFRGAARRYYPPDPIEIARLALSVMLTPFMVLAQLVLWPTGHAQNPTWLAIKSAVQRFTMPRAHAMLAAAVQEEVFGQGRGAAEHDGRAIDAAGVPGEFESVVAGEAARSDVLNTILTGVIAKVMLGQFKLGAYGLALALAPPLYFRWSSGREERIRRAIDDLLPDGRWSLSRAGWNFDWTDSFESVALVTGLFLGLSAVFAVVGYLLAPLLSPVWRRTGLPALSLRRAVEASRRQVVGGRTRAAFSPELIASKVGDVAELFWRSG